MSCDIQQVRLNDLMVSSEYTKCWAVCQKPGRLLVFPQVTIFIYPCPPELCGETPVCILQSRILMWAVNAKMKSTASFVGKCWIGETQLRLNRSKLLLKQGLSPWYLCSIGSVPLLFLLSCQLLAALWHGTASDVLHCRASPRHCLEGPLLTLLFGTEEHLHYKLQFQILTQLISESL